MHICASTCLLCMKRHADLPRVLHRIEKWPTGTAADKQGTHRWRSKVTKTQQAALELRVVMPGWVDLKRCMHGIVNELPFITSGRQGCCQDTVSEG